MGKAGKIVIFEGLGGRSRRKTTHCRRGGQRGRRSEELSIEELEGARGRSSREECAINGKSERMSPSPTWLLQTLRFRRLVPPELGPVPSFLGKLITLNPLPNPSEFIGS